MSGYPVVRATEPRVLTVSTEGQMLDLLWAMNVSGMHPELPAVMVRDIGTPKSPNLVVAPFLATLTEPDGSYVNYIVSDEGGRSRCVVGCENCGSENERDDWKPTYPVLALLGAEPDNDRAREDEIDVWWSPPPMCPECHQGKHINCTRELEDGSPCECPARDLIAAVAESLA